MLSSPLSGTVKRLACQAEWPYCSYFGKFDW